MSTTSAALAGSLSASLDPVRFASRSLRFDAEPWQASLLRSTARRQLLRCGRQVGKSTAVSVKALHRALFTGESLVLVVSPSQRQSDEFLVKVRSLYRAAGRPVATVRESASTIELVNGSRIISLPGTEGTTRGFAGVSLLILDEASRIEDDTYSAVLPMVGSAGAVWALSTPAGQRGWFFDLHSEPPAINGWARVHVPVHESAQYPPERIAELKASVSRYTWASDYEASFEDNASQLFASTDVRAALASGAGIPPLF